MIRSTWLGLGGFRARLTLWFGGLTLLTLLSVGLYVGRMATQQLADASGAALHSTAQSAADLLAANLLEREQEIVLMSQSAEFTSGRLDHVEVQRTLERRKAMHGEYAWLGVADAAGVVRQATGGMLVQQSVQQRPWFQAASRGVYTGDIHEAVLLAKLLPGNPSGEPLRFIDFAAPIRSADGRLLGVLGSHAHWNWVTQTVESAVRHQGRRPELEVLILNRAGEVLYPEPLVGTLRLPERLTGARSYGMVHWPDGQDYLTSEVTVAAGMATDLGWRIVVRLPTQIALQPVDALRQQLLVLGLVAALLFAFVAYRLASRMSQPIERLAHAVRQVERREGEPDFPQETDAREVAQLSRSIQSMTRSLLSKERELEAVNASLEATVAQRTEALTRANEELARLATRDALTGVYNRRRFDERLDECFQTLRRTGRPSALLAIDADHFKRINDTHGHPAGDAVLLQLAQLLSEQVRATDFVARYGGEEFVVLLPDVGTVADAAIVAEKIRAAVAGAVFPGVGQVTISIGVSVSDTADPDASALTRRADAALYQAKAAGRNRVSSVTPDETGG
jgi:diguanylate cyclase (GGDEF)-like protein